MQLWVLLNPTGIKEQQWQTAERLGPFLPFTATKPHAFQLGKASSS